MSDPVKAVDFALRLEDSTLSGVVTDIDGDMGGTTRFGLVSKYHPALVAAGFYDPSMPSSAALPLAEGAYAEEYANPLLIAEIGSQAVANALLGCAINEEGTGIRGTAVLLLQEACGTEQDGAMGMGTVAAVNGCDPATLLKTYCDLQKTHYQRIVDVNPSQQKFLNGWLNRVAIIEAQTV